MSLSTDTSDHAQRIAELESALAEMTAERDGWKRNCKVTLEDRILRLEDSILGLKRHNAELKAALAKPASSPAGGDVVEAVERIEAVIRMCENAQYNLCYGNVSAQAVASSAILGLGEIARVAQQALAALAQIAAPGTAMERDYADEAAPAGRITSALERAP